MRVALAFALAIGMAGQATPRVESPLVQIDAVASDARGRIVDDLRAADFEILDETGAQTLESVRFIRADGSARPEETFPPISSAVDEQAEAGHDGTRLFAFFLDEYHVTPGAVPRARAVLAHLIEQLGPRDLVLVLKPLESLLTLRLTRDRAATLRAVAGFEGRKGDLEPRTAFERNYIAGSPGRVEAVRAQIAASALNAMATHLGGLGASRKTLIVISEGFARASRRRGDETLPTIDTVIHAANRANVSVYPIDPRAFAGVATSLGETAAQRAAEEDEERRGERDALRALADETGGRAILESADGAGDLRQIVTDSSTYYLLSFRLGREAVGRFHRLDVRVKRQGVQLRTRKGYWAPSPDDLRAPSATTVPERPPAPLPRRLSPLIRPWFGVARGADDTIRVSFVWEPALRVPGDRSGAQAARITLKATRPDGTPVFDGPVRPTGPGAAALSGSDPARAVFETPPGRLRVQMSIEDATARVVDTDVREVTLKALDGAVALGTAEVLRARSAREYRALAGDAAAPPVVAREFSRAERLLIRVPVYTSDRAVVVSAKLASRLGTRMRDLPVERTASGLHQIDLPLAGLAAGEYLVELTAKAAAGEVTDTITFRVTP